jgi:arabinogalactan endo-1,4-beta-galactosidase
MLLKPSTPILKPFWNVDGLINNGFQSNNFDIIGLSSYPGESDWKIQVEDTYDNMIDLKSRYNKEVMMVEIGFSYSRQDITYQFLTYMIEKTKQADGLGVFYWEPIARSPFTSYSKGAWDADGSPSIAMDAFLDKTTLSVENFKSLDGVFNVYPNPSKSIITINALENRVNTIKLYSLNGNILIEKKGNYKNLEMDISKLTAGIYFIKINNKVVKKILKL